MNTQLSWTLYQQYQYHTKNTIKRLIVLEDRSLICTNAKVLNSSLKYLRSLVIRAWLVKKLGNVVGSIFYTILETFWYDEQILHPHHKTYENDPFWYPNIYHDVTTTTKWLKAFVDTFVIMFTTSSQEFSFSYFVLPLKDS